MSRRFALKFASFLLPVAVLVSPVAMAQEGALRNGQPGSGPPPSATEALPPGHPPTTDSPHEDSLPPGHPRTGAMRNPEAPPENSSEEDARVPAGAIVVDVKDGKGAPVVGANVTLGIVVNSIAKGESRKHLNQLSDASGSARFEGLETASQIAYRPTLSIDGATFAAPPFQLKPAVGVRSTVYVYPVVRRVEDATIVTQSLLFIEVKDDRVQVQQAISVFNFGKTAWLPENQIITLPANFTAFSAQQGMTDVGADLVEGKGVRLRGTIAPGRHDIEFRWQLPYSDTSEVSMDVGQPPNLAVARVMSPASQEMRLEATGFPPADPRMDNQGQRILVTERQMMRSDAPLRTVHAKVSGIPTRGDLPLWVTGASAALIATGIALSRRQRGLGKSRTSDSREELLREIAELERAFNAGEVGKKTYARERRLLIDALARTFPKEEAARTPPLEQAEEN